VVLSISEYGVYALMRWVHYDDDEIGGDVTGPMVPFYRRVCRIIVLRRDSEYAFYLSIWLSAVSSGLNTYDNLVNLPIVKALGVFTMVIFAIEVGFKFLSETQSCAAVKGYFAHFWNSFDFFVLVSIGVMTPVLEGQEGVTALRCLRILRLVRPIIVSPLLWTSCLPRVSSSPQHPASHIYYLLCACLCLCTCVVCAGALAAYPPRSKSPTKVDARAGDSHRFRLFRRLHRPLHPPGLLHLCNRCG
jgi:hypothetical protein